MITSRLHPSLSSFHSWSRSDLASSLDFSWGSRFCRTVYLGQMVPSLMAGFRIKVSGSVLVIYIFRIILFKMPGTCTMTLGLPCRSWPTVCSAWLGSWDSLVYAFCRSVSFMLPLFLSSLPDQGTESFSRLPLSTRQFRKTESTLYV